jgi:hypothetical protein
MKRTLIFPLALGAGSLFYILPRHKERSTSETEAQEHVERPTTEALSQDTPSAAPTQAQMPATAKDFLTAIDALSTKANPFSEEAWIALESDFHGQISTDGTALDAVFDSIRENPDHRRNKLLLVLVGLVQSPQTHHLAQDLLNADSPSAKQLGLELQERLGTTSGENLTAVLNLLETEKDEAIRMDAYYALNNAELSPDQKVGLLQYAKRDAASHQIELRRRALNTLSSLVTDAESFQVLVTSLDHSSRLIKGEAIKGIAAHPEFANPQVLEQIVDILLDSRADGYLKSIGKDVMNRLPFTAHQKLKLESLQETDKATRN